MPFLLFALRKSFFSGWFERGLGIGSVGQILFRIAFLGKVWYNNPIVMTRERSVVHATDHSIRDLKNTTHISQMCKESKEPIFITKNGYGDMVVMSLEA